jgi:hypothetical protein
MLIMDGRSLLLRFSSPVVSVPGQNNPMKMFCCPVSFPAEPLEGVGGQEVSKPGTA